MLAGKICFDAVNGADANASAANALGNDIQRAAAGSCQLQTGGVGMCVAYLHGGEGERQPFLFGEGIAVWNAQVIRLHTEQTGNERAVGAVSVSCECKTAVQRNICVYGSFTEQLAGGQSDAHGTGGVTAGRPYHNGSQNIKQTHENPP